MIFLRQLCRTYKDLHQPITVQEEEQEIHRVEWLFLTIIAWRFTYPPVRCL